MSQSYTTEKKMFTRDIKYKYEKVYILYFPKKRKSGVDLWRNNVHRKKYNLYLKKRPAGGIYRWKKQSLYFS